MQYDNLFIFLPLVSFISMFAEKPVMNREIRVRIRRNGSSNGSSNGSNGRSNGSSNGKIKKSNAPCFNSNTIFSSLTPKQPFMAENPYLRIWYKIVDLKGNAFKNTSISSCLLPFSASNSLVVDDFKKQIHREQYPLFGKKNIFIVSSPMHSEH